MAIISGTSSGDDVKTRSRSDDDVVVTRVLGKPEMAQEFTKKSDFEDACAM